MSELYSVVFDCKTSLKMAAQIYALHHFRRTSCGQWRTKGGGLGCSTPPPRNSEDIGEVLGRVNKKNRRLDFLLQFTSFSYGCNLLNKGFF